MTERIHLEYNHELLDALSEQLQTKKDHEHYPLASSLLDYLTATYQNEAERKQLFIAELNRAYPCPMSEMTDAEQLWAGPLSSAPTLLFGEENGAELLDLLRRRILRAYSTYYYRKGYRSRNLAYYMEAILLTVKYYYNALAYECTLQDYLTRHDIILSEDSIMGDRIARELDMGNETVFEALRDIMFGENQTALLTRPMIRGIVQSHNVEAYEMLGRLLIAARLQEGLRQHIMESLDEGTVEAAVYLIRIVLEHNLERFSAVIRALDTWTGLAFTDQKPAVIRKCLELALRALTEESYREEAEHSEDTLVYYFSLWATATYDIGEATMRIQRVLKDGARYKKLSSLYFLAQLNQQDMQHRIASGHLPAAVDDPEQMAWLMNSIYADYRVSYHYGDGAVDLSNSPISEDLVERREQFNALLQSLRQLKGTKTFKESVFPWAVATLDADELLRRMMTLAAYDRDAAMIEQLIDCSDRMNSSLRYSLLVNFIGAAASGKQREYLLQALNDKSTNNRKAAIKLLGQSELAAAELDKIVELMKLKTGTLRQACISLLMQQTDEELLRAADKLLSASNEQQRLAGLAIVESLQQDKQRQALYPQVRAHVQALHEKGRATAQEQVLIDKLLHAADASDGAGNGFGLYDVNENVAIPPKFDHPELADASDRQQAEREAEYVKQYAAWRPEDVAAIYLHFEALMEEHYNYEYEGQHYSNYSEKVLLGNQTYRLAKVKKADGEETAEDSLDSYPLPEVWRQAARDLQLTPMRMLVFMFGGEDHTIGDAAEKQWFTELYADVQDKQKAQQLDKALETLKHERKTNQLIRLLFHEADSTESFTACMSIYRSLRARLTVEQCVMPQAELDEGTNMYWHRDRDRFPALGSDLLEQWLTCAEPCAQSDEQFAEYFFTAYASYKLLKGADDVTLSVDSYMRAHHLGLISDSVLLREMMVGNLAKDFIRKLTHPNWNKPLLESYPGVRPLLEQAVCRIVEIESRRGDLPTEVSELSLAIHRFEGMRFFVAILTGLGKETFRRGYVYSSDLTKKAVLSSLLKCCYPAKGEDAAQLAALLEKTDLTEQRLLEAAMYAPQWVDIVQQHLGWSGLKSAAWYFHAHINETFSAQKETEVAIFSPISPQSFNDGAFDGDWFRSAYETLGVERFDLLYSCAKYITDGGNSHRRAQLFADATLGKLDKQELVEGIRSARNKDKLLSYALLPIAAGDKREVLGRYELIQQFLKESKQFGAQRRESEGKASAIALENLARNAGYGDVNRMSWDLEAEKIGEIAAYFSPQDMNGTKLWLAIDDEGQVELKVEKGGKAQKSIPTALRKNELVLAMKGAQKELKDQYTRAKFSFEQAMENGTRFTAQELGAIIRNPVIAPLVRHLVWIDAAGAETGKGGIGYLQEPDQGANAFMLRQPDGGLLTLQSDTGLLLAHPVHLYASGRWSEFQRDLFVREIKQPFKQVFREYYRLNADETAAVTVSRRYAGHQVQPQRTVALLRGRTWTVDYEEGLQKVYYKENLIARMYAMADWFTPADIEPPTLETVQFFNRETMEPIKLAEVPPVIFSEVMRDIDLVVSVAHAGGVDPEASHSTVEMRIAIAQELLMLLKVDNVRLEGSHAHVAGKLGEYSVHMGSGIVHKKGTGALTILPVHSQSRGRLFLPFADSDPRTAEIMSKLLLLAEDSKIKDPSILAML
ncbi:protein of unknown function [Paenibacillus tianmuensis]|uniref:DUF4132 domain-containing protein n=1 Tax=Paenibacillus tianmuensis TaxID=624147 RepID=A0A1G4TLZ7_9BACL|nr:DUF4132 domain-containing protein [Paenibacillus tianmuensis]SCW82277.1 protein of unknown function [Paenibacillus tianmuensis]